MGFLECLQPGIIESCTEFDPSPAVLLGGFRLAPGQPGMFGSSVEKKDSLVTELMIHRK